MLGASLVAQRQRICQQCRSRRRLKFHPWVGKIPWRRSWQPSPVFFPGESHEQRSLASYSLWGRKELDATEHARTIVLELLENGALWLFRVPKRLLWLLQLAWTAQCSNDLKKLILSPWRLRLHHKVSRTIIEEINTVFNHLAYSLASKISIIKSYRVLNKEKINGGKLYVFFVIASVMFNSLWSYEIYIACQAPLSMGFSRQEYWSGLPCPLPGGSFQHRGGSHVSCLLHQQASSLPLVAHGKPPNFYLVRFM